MKLIAGKYSMISCNVWCGVIESLFHAWERRLAAVTKDRVVRPFDWGVE